VGLGTPDLVTNAVSEHRVADDRKRIDGGAAIEGDRCGLGRRGAQVGRPRDLAAALLAEARQDVHEALQLQGILDAEALLVVVGGLGPQRATPVWPRKCQRRASQREWHLEPWSMSRNTIHVSSSFWMHGAPFEVRCRTEQDEQEHHDPLSQE